MPGQPVTSPRPGFLKRLAIAGVNLLTPLHAGLIATYFALRWLGGGDLWFVDALPLIVIGDFNLTDQQSLYTSLTRHLRDAHREGGWGMGFTFTPLPAARPPDVAH